MKNKEDIINIQIKKFKIKIIYGIVKVVSSNYLGDEMFYHCKFDGEVFCNKTIKGIIEDLKKYINKMGY